MTSVQNESANPRKFALDCLEKAGHGKAVQEILNSKLSCCQLSLQGRHLATDLVYGFLRHLMPINHLLETFISKPGGLPVPLRNLLGLGIYSLLYQEKIPDYAAINETVKIAKKMYGPKMANLANAVLRKIQKLGDAPLNPDFYKSKLPDFEAKSIFYGVPFSISNLWRKAYGDDSAILLMRRSSQRPWLGLRFNAAKNEGRRLCENLRENDVRKKIGNWAWAFSSRKVVEKIAGKAIEDLEKEGLLSLQSPASILILEKLGLNGWENPLWDCCAGSGIKLTALLENRVPVSLASDISKKRINNIRPFCYRLGLNTPQLLLDSAARSAVRLWDGDILADVPCSGLGTLARRPDIKLRFMSSADILREYVKTQREILDNLAHILRKGCKLAYITCTLNPDENQGQIQRLLKNCPDLTLLEEWQSPDNAVELDGMYGAVLKKN